MPEVVMLASSGTGAMEACVTNLTHKKHLQSIQENLVKDSEKFVLHLV